MRVFLSVRFIELFESKCAPTELPNHLIPPGCSTDIGISISLKNQTKNSLTQHLNTLQIWAILLFHCFLTRKYIYIFSYINIFLVLLFS